MFPNFYSWTTFDRGDTAMESCACLLMSTAMLICSYMSLVRNARTAVLAMAKSTGIKPYQFEPTDVQITVMIMTIVASQKLI